MLAVTRKQKIKDLVQEKKSVTVAELAKQFSVTDETIRRDLKVLEEEGVLFRTYGGAFIQSGVENVIDVDIRDSVYVESKEIIADLCCDIMHNGDTIFLDCSTTCLYVARAIKSMRLTVLTNSLKITNLLSDCDNIRLITIGGFFSRKEMAFYGHTGANTLNEYFVDKAFISCRSLTVENGITDSDEQLAEIRQTVIKRAQETYVLADYSKFNYTSFLRICGFDSITGIVTDRALGSEWHEAMASYGVSIIEGQ